MRESSRPTSAVDEDRHPSPLLKVDEIHAGYGRTEILRGVTLEVHPGQIVALLGRNGAGKTTTLKAISGELSVSSGSVLFDGVSVTNKKPHKIAKAGIAHVREGHQIFPTMSVQDNLEMGAFLRRGAAEIEQDLDRVMDMFPVLRTKAGQRAALLSGGEQQMLSLAQGLMLRPRLLICDEPSLGLAPIVVNQIFENIIALRSTGVTVLLVEQRVTHALQICDHAFILDDGRVQHQGKASDLQEGTLMRDNYLGSMQETPR